jgi:hypothetical protein
MKILNKVTQIPFTAIGAAIRTAVPTSGIKICFWFTDNSNLLTPWCRILFEKLIVTQLIKKYHALLWN